MMKGAMNGDMSSMMRNPKQMQQMLAKTIDPKMLSKLGGAGNMMDMMKQMSDAEGPMGAMMKQMQSMQGKTKVVTKKR